MAFEIGVGGGQTATVHEPDRLDFADNLGGALQYMLAHGLYAAMQVMGGAIGSFLAGIGVQFMERIEPSLVEYAAPLLDLILDQKDLHPAMREFFEALRHPAHEGAAALLGGLASQAGGSVVGSVMGSLTAKITYGLNQLFRPAIPDLSAILTMFYRGLLTEPEMRLYMASWGYDEALIDQYVELARQRAGPSDLLQGWLRENLKDGEFVTRMQELGYTNEAINLIRENSQQLMGFGDMLRAVFRGEMSYDEMRAIMHKQGWSDIDITTLMNASKPLPGPDDLIRMSVREAFNDVVARQWSYDEDFPERLTQYMALQGWDPQWGKYWWRAHWNLPSVSAGYEMMHRGVISPDELKLLLKVSDIPVFWRERLIDISYTPFTRVDVRRMYKLGILDRAGVKQSYKDIGYDEAKSEAMTEFTVRYETATGGSKVEDYQELTKAVVMQALRKGILTRGEAQTRLMELGYAQEDIGVLLELATWQKQIDDTPDYTGDYQKDVKAVVEKAYSRRVLVHDEAKSILTGLGFGEAEAEYTLSSVDFWYGMESLNKELKAVGDAYVARGINRTDVVTRLGALGITGELQQQVLDDWTIDRQVRSRRLTEAQYRKAMGDEIISQEEYMENLRGLGYTDYDVWVLTSMAVEPEARPPKPRGGPL